MSNKNFENTTVEYTGGGIYVFSALYNGKTWLYGPLDQYICGYDMPGEEIYQGDQDYEAHRVDPPEGYPSWQDIIAAVIGSGVDDTQEIIETIHQFNPAPGMPCNM